MTEPLLRPYHLNAERRERLDHEGHLVLPGLLTPDAGIHLVCALADIQAQKEAAGQAPQHFSAEHNAYLAGLIAHPDMLALARAVLGPEIRFDHCVALNRPQGDRGTGWHSHEYADDRPELGFLRIFFYVNGFEADDGGLGVVPGSHRYRDAAIGAASDADLRAGWLAGKTHLRTGAPLQIEYLSAPARSVILMWTHAAHAVSPRRSQQTRWTVVYAYRNPGAPSRARWITPAFEQHPPPGAEGLMSLL